MAQSRSVRRDIVLDSSVVIKWFSEEEYSEIALALREEQINGSRVIAIPDLLLMK